MNKKLILTMFLSMFMLSMSFGALNNADLYYSFDESDTTGTTMVDISGNGNNGTCVGMTNCNTVEGLLFNASNFDGLDDKLDLPFSLANTQLNGANAVTYSFWINASTFSGTQFIHHMDNNQLNIRLQSNNIVLEARSEVADTTKTEFGSITINDLNKWYHIIVILDFQNNEIVTYIDNVKDIDSIVTFSSSTLNWTASTLYHFGQRTSDFFYSGDIDELAIYNRRLNVSEISELYNSGTGFNPYIAVPTIPNAFQNIFFIDEPIVNDQTTTRNDLYWTLDLNESLALTNFSVDFNGTGFNKYMDLPINNSINISNKLSSNSIGGIEFYNDEYFVVDPNNNTIIKYDINYNYIGSYDVSSEKIGLSNANNIVIIDDYVYVFFTDFNTVNYLAKYNLSMNYESSNINMTSLGIINPQSFYFDNVKQKIYISRGDVGIRDIYELNKSFSIVNTYNYSELSLFRDITRYNNSYYILDSLEIKKYDLDFTFISTEKNLFTSSFCTTASGVSLINSGGLLSLGCTNTTGHLYKLDFSTYNLVNSSKTFYNRNNLADGDYTIQFRVENSTTLFNSSIYTFHIDATDPIINNSLPTEINTYLLNISNYVSCSDNINLKTCNITFSPDGNTVLVNQTSLYNFTYNGNQTYNIIAEDQAGNIVNQSGVIFVNPYAYFRFNDSLTGQLIDDYTFGDYQSNNTYTQIPIYDLGLGNQSLLFNKFGYNNQTFNFTFTNISRINTTFNISPTTLNIKVFDATTLNQINFNMTIFNSSNIEDYLNQFNFSKRYNETVTGDITIVINSIGYKEAKYFNTLNNATSITINAYLFQDNLTNVEVVQFFTRETGTDKSLDSVLIEAQRLIGGELVTISQATTDDSGSTFMWLDTSLTYSFVFSKTGYSTSTANSIPGVNSYTIKLERDIDAREYIDGINIMFTPSLDRVNSASNQNFKTFITGVSITTMTYELIDQNGTVIYTDTSTNPTGTTFNRTLNVSGYTTLTQKITYVVDGITNTKQKTYKIISIDSENFLEFMKTFNDTSDEGTNIFVWIVMFISIGGAFMVGGKVGQPTLFVIITAGFFTFTEWMPMVYFGVLTFTAIVFWMAFGGTK